MSNPPDLPVHQLLERPWEPNSGKGTLPDYLDEFCLPLYEVMSTSDVEQYRLLAYEHILDLMEEYKDQGLSEYGALQAALHEHGDPKLIGALLQNEWLKDGKTPAVQPVAKTAAVTVGWSLAVCYICLALMLCLAPDAISILTAIFVMPLPAGGLIGTLVFTCHRKSWIWRLLALLHPVVLTALVIAMRWGAPAVAFLLPLWLVGVLIVAGLTGRFWFARRQREIVCRFLA